MMASGRTRASSVVMSRGKKKGQKERKAGHNLNAPKIVESEADRATSSDGVGLVGLIFQLGRLGTWRPIPRKMHRLDGSTLASLP
jgi:hypothetical protein